MESQIQNPEFRNNPKNFYPWHLDVDLYFWITGISIKLHSKKSRWSLYIERGHRLFQKNMLCSISSGSSLLAGQGSHRPGKVLEFDLSPGILK